MTYCIAVTLNDGLVLTSDSRTNAGIDNVSTYGKMHTFSTSQKRKLVLLSAGNLATTQAVVEQLRRDIKENSAANLNNVPYLSDAAEYLGKVSLEKQKKHADKEEGQSGFTPTATFIIAGQISDEPPGAYLIYPEGNSITSSQQTPFLQIGESKYGKPVLDRFLQPDKPVPEIGECLAFQPDQLGHVQPGGEHAGKARQHDRVCFFRGRFQCSVELVDEGAVQCVGRRPVQPYFTYGAVIEGFKHGDTLFRIDSSNEV